MPKNFYCISLAFSLIVSWARLTVFPLSFAFYYFHSFCRSCFLLIICWNENKYKKQEEIIDFWYSMGGLQSLFYLQTFRDFLLLPIDNLFFILISFYYACSGFGLILWNQSLNARARTLSTSSLVFRIWEKEKWIWWSWLSTKEMKWKTKVVNERK